MTHLTLLASVLRTGLVQTLARSLAWKTRMTMTLARADIGRHAASAVSCRRLTGICEGWYARVRMPSRKRSERHDGTGQDHVAINLSTADASVFSCCFQHCRHSFHCLDHHIRVDSTIMAAIVSRTPRHAYHDRSSQSYTSETSLSQEPSQQLWRELACVPLRSQIYVN